MATFPNDTLSRGLTIRHTSLSLLTRAHRTLYLTEILPSSQRDLSLFGYIRFTPKILRYIRCSAEVPSFLGALFYLRKSHDHGRLEKTQICKVRITKSHRELLVLRHQNSLPLTTNLSQKPTQSLKGISYPVGNLCRSFTILTLPSAYTLHSNLIPPTDGTNDLL